MNRIVTFMALVAVLFAGFFATANAQAQGTAKKPAPACTKCATKKAAKTKAAFHRSAKTSASCCTGGACCGECPTCCVNNTCNTGKCPKGCCNISACLPGASCCK